MKVMRKKYCKILFAALFLAWISFNLVSCGVVKKTYKVSKGVVKTTYGVTKGTVKALVGAGEIVYKIGEFTFKVVKAPFDWPLTNENLETMDGLPPKEAIRKGRVKMSPYVVKGKRYVPMSLEKARKYKQEGVASWYGQETRRQKGGHMTANGEAFDPEGLNAAHKYLPLPYHVRVTNLRNGRSLVLRVNDRGPFVKGRIIDVSAGAAKKLGFFRQGTTRVRVVAIEVPG